MAAPIEIEGLGKANVKFVWDSGEKSSIATYELRLKCSCAHCIEEGTGRKILNDAQVPKDILVSTIDLVGNYGIKIGFSDGHDTGIYTFRKLASLMASSLS